MEQYTVTGMSCAACSSRVEKAVSAVPGVTSCSVSLLTNSMGVEGTASSEAVIAAVEKAGYGAVKKSSGRSAGQSLGGASGRSSGQSPGRSSGRSSENTGASSAGSGADRQDALKDRETPKLRRRLIASLGFLAVLMYFSMGHMLWDWPLPPFLRGNHVAMGLLQLLLSAAVMVINQKFFVNGFKGLLHRAPNMDTLVALGSAAAFGYSTYALFAMTGAQVAGDMDAVMRYMDEFYFESAATILALITVGKMLEARSKGKTTDALKSLLSLSPKTATLVRDGVEVTVPVEQVLCGDIFVVRPGESIPVDGVVLEGGGAVDESALTGESIPKDKSAGDTVSAATVNRSGYLRCRATRVGEDTTLSKIIQMVSDAAATKAPIARIADRVSGVFVPAVMTVAAVTMLVWLIQDRGVGFALARGISVLVISCPCALGLATPVAIMVGNGVGARNGILFKTSAALENTGRTRIVALDKTGTITKGEPAVTDLIPVCAADGTELLAFAYALEKFSEHPLAGAIVRRAEAEGMVKSTAQSAVTEFKAIPGGGLTGVCDGQVLAGGSLSYIGSLVKIPDEISAKAQALATEGKTPLLFARGTELIGMIAVADVIKEDSPGAIRVLREMGIRVVMLTGDNKYTAEAVGKQAGVDEVIAGVLPDGKQAVITELKKQGKVAMVGDGINDSPALTAADVGIAIGAGTDVAIDSADVVLMNSRLSDVPAAIRLSRRTLTNIHENLFWAFIYNVIGIPIAAGVFIQLFGWELNPMFAAAAMSLSSFCVVTNALRLNFVRLHGKQRRHGKAGGKTGNGQDTGAPSEAGSKTAKTAGKDTNQTTKKGDTKMKKTMKIEGMMCGHCSGRVKQTLEALGGVESAEVSHENGTAVVVCDPAVSDGVLTAAVEGQGYHVTAVTEG